jgi:L-lactate dehydrogenase complex protein LldE
MGHSANRSVSPENGHKRVGLFATCLIDLFRPEAGFAAVTLLEQAGFLVEVPEQGCCGQPNFNGGDSSGARAMARSVISTFADYDFVVVPSCSCAAMIKNNYPELFESESSAAEQARQLADKTWELTSFLVDVVGFTDVAARFESNVAVHDSCSGLRELKVQEQPRNLLGQVAGLTQVPLKNSDVCCGFGGTFCVKYPDVSNRIAEKKIADIETTDQSVDVLVSTDLGCLMHLSGKLHRDGSAIQTMHIAEVLTALGTETDDGQ